MATATNERPAPSPSLPHGAMAVDWVDGVVDQGTGDPIRQADGQIWQAASGSG